MVSRRVLERGVLRARPRESPLSVRGRTIRPVFIVGCQRSGSTLLGAMLGAHSDVIYIPEGLG